MNRCDLFGRSFRCLFDSYTAFRADHYDRLTGIAIHCDTHVELFRDLRFFAHENLADGHPLDLGT
ncbi:MAG: hypothetical protein A4E62_01510 [Syntrophorhabdus sp. PtaU1.Bin002]|nr:MAG: hypothetical protein A4E62_01510 [Syntrophorhabdus sp. PtaU1.Bin002]